MGDARQRAEGAVERVGREGGVPTGRRASFSVVGLNYRAKLGDLRCWESGYFKCACGVRNHPFTTLFTPTTMI